MVRNGCEDAVERTVRRVDGIQEMKADHVAATFTVSFDSSRIDVQAIRNCIMSAGHAVSGRVHATQGEKSPLITAVPTEELSAVSW